MNLKFKSISITFLFLSIRNNSLMIRHGVTVPLLACFTGKEGELIRWFLPECPVELFIVSFFLDFPFVRSCEKVGTLMCPISHENQHRVKIIYFKSKNI